MQDTAAAELSYYQERMNQLNITDTENTIHLLMYNAAEQKNTLIEKDIFRAVELGIFIRVYTIDRLPVTYAKEGSRHKVNDYGIIRLKDPVKKPDGSVMKYRMPKGQPVLPFFPPDLVAKYDEAATIDTLYLTEGYFKAFKAQMHGIDCVGLASITCMRDRETGKLHGDIHKLILKCKVKRIVWLMDGDCRNITSKEVTDGTDLQRRPDQFFKTVGNFYDLLSPYDDLNKYFAHINSENLDGEPKGIDDLLCMFPDREAEIKRELFTFDKNRENGDYLIKFNITFGLGGVRKYFLLHDVDTFYLHHLERRPELKGKDFKFYGTLYRYNEAEGKCNIQVPSSAADYFRVGDDYYQYVSIPNRYKELEKQYHRRSKETIREDNGKEIFRHIPKYAAFCTVPDHTNYQRVINNCFNCYFPFEHEPEEGDCDITIEFIKHIFGSEPVQLNDEVIVPRYELGFDYLTLLYKHPQQILPILSLVSNERQTGKTTFVKWLSLLFTENVAIVGNDDLGAQFNAHWTSKLIVACDETKIDKHVVMEKIKSLSTASKIMMNAKGRDQRSMEFFGKFILCSNNEDDFARIEKEEIRFWVIKVPSIATRNVELLSDMLQELPAFLHYINKRSLITQNKERHWFETRLLRTDALDKVVANSRPTLEKLINHAITDLFESSEDEVITMPLNAIANEILKKPADKDYIARVLRGMGYKTQEPQRRRYPRIQERSSQSGGIEIGVTYISFQGRYYEFYRHDFIKAAIASGSTQTPDDLPF